MNITRRGFLQGAIVLAGAGMTTALAVPALKTLLPPPVTRCNEDDAHETLTYKSELIPLHFYWRPDCAVFKVLVGLNAYFPFIYLYFLRA